jgi:hypothetical protein
LACRATGIGAIVADEQQHEGFRKAVERKKQESKEASERTADTAGGGSEIEGDQNDEQSPRTQGSRHKKVTADKWNQ